MLAQASLGGFWLCPPPLPQRTKSECGTAVPQPPIQPPHGWQTGNGEKEPLTTASCSQHLGELLEPEEGGWNSVEAQPSSLSTWGSKPDAAGIPRFIFAKRYSCLNWVTAFGSSCNPGTKSILLMRKVALGSPPHQRPLCPSLQVLPLKCAAPRTRLSPLGHAHDCVGFFRFCCESTWAYSCLCAAS